MQIHLLIPLSILVSSFIGSWHCAGMCGPFAALTGSRGQLWHYHAGRLLIYVALGALSGALGEFVLKSEFTWLRTFGAISLGMMLILMGLQYLLAAMNWWHNSHSWAGRIFQVIYGRIKKYKLSRCSFVIGLMAGLLPCMWLYTYVVASAATKSPFAGSLVMFLFWLGGLPALSAVAMMIKPSLAKSHVHKQKVAGVVLVCAGLYALGSHLLGH
ncbi:sulfite exporter TauE/SafE family protein [Bdellovibrio sp. HCB337]|uniref:sulfite exporter TauE/SafE family protein n=1 Tax=Bdellovibrio sp. HCB337 TaxID=3394358 RepID=UPI0039A404B1